MVQVGEPYPRIVHQIFGNVPLPLRHRPLVKAPVDGPVVPKQTVGHSRVSAVHPVATRQHRPRHPRAPVGNHAA